MSEKETSRRTVLRGSALGAGALIGAAGLAATARAATGATPADMLAVAPSSPGPNGDRYFLKLDGIPGDSVHKGFEHYIELSDFSWGASRPAKNGVAKGKATADEVQFRAPSSKASPLLMLNTVTGESIGTASLVVANNQGRQFIKGELTDVVVSSYGIAGQDEENPYDHGALSFGKIKFAFYPQNPNGGLDEPVVMEWDTRAAKF